jgi:hypothetical protein
MCRMLRFIYEQIVANYTDYRPVTFKWASIGNVQLTA